jgi:hypothetical protein
MTMRCENCGQYGIRWMGRLTDLTHTECPHCGGANCQEAPEVWIETYEDDEDASVAFYSAQAGTHPQGRDAKQTRGDSLSDAVPEGDAPEHSPHGDHHG